MRRGLVAATLGLAGLGAAVGRPLVVVLAAVPLSVLAVDALSAPPAPRVAVERELSSAAPALGERVTVRVTVENRGEPVVDCLIADEIPDGVDAVDDPRTSVRLPAGTSTTLEYAVVARRGTHEFGAVEVTARGLLADAPATHEVATSFRCRSGGRPLALRASVGRRVGDRRDDTGGSGVEFHSVREYRPSDPQRRIDWRRFARSGELTTVEFREEHSVTVHLLVDVRAVCDVRGRAVDPSALAYGADATERLARGLLGRGVDVGVGLYPGSLDALPPAGGRPQCTRVERLFEDHEALPWGDGDVGPRAGGPEVADGGGASNGRRVSPADVAGGGEASHGSRGSSDRRSDGELPEPIRRGARILLVSPCFDDAPVEFATAVDEAGGDIGVLSPGVDGETAGVIVEGALREARLARLRGTGVPTVDWDVDASLSAAVEEVFATWT